MRTTDTPGDTPAGRRTTSTRGGDYSRAFRHGASEAPRTGAADAGRRPRPGRSAFKEATKGSGTRDHFFKVEYEKKYLIKFLEAENFDFVERHELENVPNGDGGVWLYAPRNCIKDVEAGVTCPLCAIGHTPKALALFNVVDLQEPDKVLLWEVSKGIFDEIDALAEELSEIPAERGGPLTLDADGVYVAVSKKKSETKTGRGGFTEYKVVRIKPRDLREDHNLEPLTEEQMEDLTGRMFTSDDIKFNTAAELRKLADALED